MTGNNAIEKGKTSEDVLEKTRNMVLKTSRDVIQVNVLHQHEGFKVIEIYPDGNCLFNCILEASKFDNGLHETLQSKGIDSVDTLRCKAVDSMSPEVILNQVAAELPDGMATNSSSLRLMEMDREHVVCKYRERQKKSGVPVDQSLMVATLDLLGVDPVVLNTRFTTYADSSSWLSVSRADSMPSRAPPDWALLCTELAVFSNEPQKKDDPPPLDHFDLCVNMKGKGKGEDKSGNGESEGKLDSNGNIGKKGKHNNTAKRKRTETRSVKGKRKRKEVHLPEAKVHVPRNELF